MMSKQIVWLFAFIILVFVGASDAQATRYWAATTGSDANACAAVDGTEDPGTYRTVTGAVACATSVGDEVFIKPGTYDVSIINPPDGITIQGSDSAIANWPVLAPAEPAGGRVIRWGQTRTSLTTIRYIFIDLNDATGPTHGCIDSDGFVPVLIEHFKCRGPANRAITSLTGSGIQPGHGAPWTVRHGEIWNWKSPSLTSGPGVHGFYWRGSNGLIEHVHVHDNEGYAIQVYKGGGGNILRYNLFENNGAADTPLAGGGIFCCDGSGNIVHNNIVRGEVNDGIKAQTGSSNQIYNNTLYNNGRDGIRILASTGYTIRNNIALANGNSQISSCLSNTCSNNLTTGTATDIFTNPSGDDLSLKAGSAAINAGTSVGFSFNGAAPDQGAFETWGTSATATANGQQVDISFPMNLNTPVAPSTGITGFTLSDSRTVTAASRLSDTIVRLTYTGTCTGGTWSYSGGNLKDGAQVGNSNGTFISQPLHTASTQAITDQCDEEEPPDPPSGLHIHYELADGSGTTAADETANNLDGTLAGDSLPTWETGAITFAAGVNDRIDIPYGNAVNPTTQSLTMCMGVRPTDGRGSSTQTIFGSANGTNQRLNIQQHTGSWKIAVQSGVSAGSSQFAVQEANTHICLRMDSSTDVANLFVNGVKGTDSHTQKSYTSFALASDLDLGQSDGASVESGATIDYFKLWTLALTDQEVLDEFNAWQPPTPPSTGTYTQVAYQWYLLRQHGGALLKLPSSGAAVSASINVPADAVLVVEAQIDCTAADCDPINSVLQYDLNDADSWSSVPDVCGDVCFYGTSDVDSTIPSGAPDCPLSGALTCVDGGTQRTANAEPTVDMAQNNSTVMRAIVRLNVAVGTKVEFRWRNQNGNLYTYDQVATVNIINAVAGAL